MVRIEGGEAVMLLIVAITKSVPRADSLPKYSFLTDRQRSEFRDRFIVGVGQRPKGWKADDDGRLVYVTINRPMEAVSFDTCFARPVDCEGGWDVDDDGRLQWVSLTAPSTSQGGKAGSER